MPTNKDYNKYQDEYKKNNYDRLTLLLPKMSKDKIRTIAEKQGLSINAWINKAIQEKIERYEKVDPETFGKTSKGNAPESQDSTN